MSGSLRGTRLALISCLILSGPPALAQASPVWVDPPSGSDDPAAPGPAAPLRFAQPPLQTASVSREQAARDLAYAYLALWSAPNRVTLASASSFYGPTVTFHGTTRTIGSVLAEKRRFAERWPDRNYRHRPETTQVACEGDGDRCTVRSSFDFDAGNPRQRQRALGIGEHELVVSFASGTPVIESENSRVIRRGHGNMTWLLRAGVEFAAPVDLEKLGTRIRLPAQRAAPSSSPPELKAPLNAVARCGDFLTAQARELGSEEVSVSGAGPEVRSPDGAVAVLINARIGYAREGKKQVRQARVTCRIDPGGRVVALH
jgi:hypothetical protein